MKSIESEAQGVLARFESTWTFDVGDLRKPNAEVVVQKLIADCAEINQERLRHEFFAAGPLEALVQDSSVTEIIVNGADEIWF